MDRRDHDVPVSTNLDDNTEGWFGEYGPYYAVLLVAAVAGGAVYYKKHILK
jgi:hypothetical protein